MNPDNLEIIIPGIAGAMAIMGIIVLSGLGRETNDTLNTLAVVFSAWAFGSGVHRVAKERKRSDGNDNE